MLTTEQRPKWRGYFDAAVTPFNEDGTIDFTAFRENLEQMINDGIHGVVVAGTTGEYWALTPDERKTLFEVAATQIHGRITAVGGATALRTEEVIDFARCAHNVGLDGIMVAPSPGAMPNRRELVRHYQAISDAVDIGIMLYNHKERYGVEIPPELGCELANFTNVVAEKESTADFAQLTNTIRLAGDRFAVMAGWPQLWMVATIAMGAAGHVGSIGCQLMGRTARDVWDFVHSNQLAKAQTLQFKLFTMQREGLVGNGTWPANLKAAMNLLGKPGGYPRAPVMPVTDDEKRRIKDVLLRLELL